MRGRGVGLLECARRPNPGLNTVKRYAPKQPDALRRAPRGPPSSAPTSSPRPNTRRRRRHPANTRRLIASYQHALKGQHEPRKHVLQ